MNGVDYLTMSDGSLMPLSTDNREVWNKGFTQWRSTDIPSNVSAAQMLEAFKALRD